MHFPFRYLILVLLGTAALAGCSLVDEDLRDCATDCRLHYQLRLITNMTAELQTQLDLEADLMVSRALEEYLKSIFTDRAHDVDLSFYDVGANPVRLHHEQHIMDANQTSYTLYIPVHRYMHVAVANLEGNGAVQLTDDGYANTTHLRQQAADTVDVQRSGLFSARLPMEVQEDLDQEFNVRLYMANCAAAVVLDTLGSHVRDIRVVGTGFASSFSLADSTFRFERPSVIRAEKVPVEGGTESCYVTVNFPSRDVGAASKADGEESPALWQMRVYATLPGGSVTESVLQVKEPLQAGRVKIIKCRMNRQGEAVPADASVGLAVRLDWQSGGEHIIDL